jgi:hypothetical protein
MRATDDRNMPYIADMLCVAICHVWLLTLKTRREECIMIAKLLRKLSFTRHYGAYGAHEWDAYAGDD